MMILDKNVNVVRVTGLSDANAELTVNIPTAVRRRLLIVTVKYSANVTQNVTVILDSHAGSAWDTILETIALAAASDGVWIPDLGDLVIGINDAIKIVAPAGGGGVTSAIAVYLEPLR